jgi:hypothetical protein
VAASFIICWHRNQSDVYFTGSVYIYKCGLARGRQWWVNAQRHTMHDLMEAKKALQEFAKRADLDVVAKNRKDIEQVSCASRQPI